MKIVQIVNGTVAWITPFKTLAETLNKYPRECIFVEAPDYVFTKWKYITTDEDGNIIYGNGRFIEPTPPDGYVYNPYNGEFIKEEDMYLILSKAQYDKQEENKLAFAKFLNDNPIIWVDGKTYGVTLEDQSEISLNIAQYNIQINNGVENPTLEWHAKKEACTKWSIEDLSALALAISKYVYPWFTKMNEYKSRIYNAKSKAEIDAIEISYSIDPIEDDKTDDIELDSNIEQA